MILGRRELSVGLLIFGAVISVYLVLLASPTRAQVPEPGDIVVDFSVNVVQGECEAGECPDGARPVTLEPEFSVDRDASRDDLDDDEIAEINEILENQADVEVTVQVPGPDETIGADEAVCLEPGQYEFTAEVVNEDELAAAINGVIDGAEFMEGDLLIEEFEDTFVVEECPDDNNGDTIDIDDRDQTNVCNNVVNIITRDVQNPDVDVNNEQAISGSVSGDVNNEQVVEVSNEQVMEVAQELNISPVIVQQCIQQNAGRDAIIGDDDNNNGGGNNDDDDGDDTGVKDSVTSTIDDCITVEEETATSTESASAADSATGTGTADTDSSASATTQECTIVDTAPNKPLPFTGGLPVVYYSIVVGCVLLGVSLLGTGFGVWRTRQR